MLDSEKSEKTRMPYKKEAPLTDTKVKFSREGTAKSQNKFNLV